MHIFRTFRKLAIDVVTTSPRKAAGSLILMVAMSFTEGIGLLLLMPLLGLVGVNEPNTLPNVTRWFDVGFAAVGVAPSLGSVLLLYVAIVGTRALLQRWQGRVSADVQEDFTSTMRIRVYRAIAGAEWKFLVTRRPSEFAHILTGEITALGVAALQIINLAVMVMVSAVYLGLAFHLSPAMAMLVLACAGTLAWAVRGKLDTARALGERASAARGTLHTAIAEHVGSMKTARTYGVADRHAEIFTGLAHDLRDVSVEVAAEETDLQQSLEFGSTALLAFIVFVSLEILKVPAAPMLVLLFVFARLMPRLVAIHRQVQTLTNLLPILDAVDSLEQACLEAAEPVAAERDVKFVRGIRFEDISFTYPQRADAPAVHDLNLEIVAGLTTAIVGPSGSGKSTVADLLIGLVSPTDGRILIDGEPLGAERLAGWRRHISYVPQDTFLFHDTVRANLTWACPGASDHEMHSALHLAAADEFVSALPQGLDTVVGERGVLVSGGERQRLSLARALLRRPHVLVLDEATSSLDSENELRIQRAVEGLHEQMTIVVITHRLSTIRHADLIHVLDRGMLVESGRWNDLIARPGGRFRELCRAQGISDRPALGESGPMRVVGPVARPQ